MKIKFIKMYTIILILCYIFLFCGGWRLFDFNKHYFIATAACAFIISVVAYAFITQEERIEQLEKKVKELQEKLQSSST